MGLAMCEHEDAVVRAARTGFWSEDLRAHCGQCPACGEMMLVAAALLESDSRTDLPLPDAGLVWWKAELKLKRERASRALRPVVYAERATAAAIVAVLAMGAAWLPPVSQPVAIAAIAGVVILTVAAGSALLLAISRK